MSIPFRYLHCLACRAFDHANRDARTGGCRGDKLVVIGQSIGGGLAQTAGLGSVFQTVWSIAQWPIVACLVLFAFALIYYFAPDVEQRWRWISPGSVLAFVYWRALSLLFSLCLHTFGTYDKAYGALTGVIALVFYIHSS